MNSAAGYGRKRPRGRSAAESDLQLLLTIASRCNHAQVVPSGDGESAWQVVGDPTKALIVAALKARIQLPDQGQHVLFEIPFDSERKAMSVVLPQADDGATMHTKGAPEEILARCVAERRDGKILPLTDSRRREIMQANAEDGFSRAAGVGVRLPGLGNVSRPIHGDGPGLRRIEGMIDPPREEVKQSVATCRAPAFARS